MIPFTDEDLKKLKDELNANGEIYDCVLPALVGRLEAAERVARTFENNPDYLEALTEWRKAAGKLAI